MSFVYYGGSGPRCILPTPGPDSGDVEPICRHPNLVIAVERGCLVPPGVVKQFIDGEVVPKTVRGALVMEMRPGHVRAWSGDVAIDVLVQDRTGTSVGGPMDVFQDLMPLDESLGPVGGPLPAGPDPAGIRPLDGTTVFLNKGAC